jgi:hypothetical protein
VLGLGAVHPGALLDMQIRIFGPYLAAIDRILTSLMVQVDEDGFGKLQRASRRDPQGLGDRVIHAAV